MSFLWVILNVCDGPLGYVMCILCMRYHNRMHEFNLNHTPNLVNSSHILYMFCTVLQYCHVTEISFDINLFLGNGTFIEMVMFVCQERLWALCCHRHAQLTVLVGCSAIYVVQ